MTDIRPHTVGVVGWPIAHSKSPSIFRHWFRLNGVPARYRRLAISARDFETVLRILPRAGFRGVNVTAPHKIRAFELADAVSASARKMGAANLLSFGSDGRLHADNTDGYGFIENLKSKAPNWRAPDGPAAVLGAGGAARAVIHALLSEGVPEIRLFNRSRERATALAEESNGKIVVLDWERRSQALDDAALLVNSTSLGMTGKAALEIDLKGLHAKAVVVDLVYAPLETDLLAAAKSKGNPVVDGLGMLLHQARPAFRAWFGIDPLVDRELREICLA